MSHRDQQFTESGRQHNSVFETDEEDNISHTDRNVLKEAGKPDLDELLEKSTNWSAILLVSFINYLIYLPAYTLTVVNFNYLLAIDRSVPVDYNGWMRALMRLGHAIGSASFAVHCYTTKSYHPSLIVGRILAIISCVLYGVIEIFPETDRRWPWLAIFLVQDMAQGSAIIFRSYVARLSTHADRQTACAFLNAGEMIAIVSGPGIQGLAGLIECDFHMAEFLRLNKYTAPIWISLMISIVTLIITTVFFKEPEEDDIVGKADEELSLREKFRIAWRQLKSMDAFVIGGCLAEKCIGSFGSTTILTLAAPFITATFNTDKYSTFLSSFQIIAGCSSIVTVILVLATKASKKLSPVITLAFGLSSFLVMYAASYPWLSATSLPVVLRDVNHSLGCDREAYSWCEATRIVSPWLWVAVSGVLIGIAVPLSSIGFDTIYSRELGNIDQNIMQAVLVVFVDLVMAFVPVIATTCFKLYGPNKWWLGVVGVMTGGLILLLVLKPRLKKQEALKSHQPVISP